MPQTTIGQAFEDESSEDSDDFLCTEVLQNGYLEISIESDEMEVSPYILISFDQTINLIRHLSRVAKLLDCAPQRMGDRTGILNTLDAMYREL